MKIFMIDSVTYLGNYLLEIYFNDGNVQRINFESFLFLSHHPDIVKYQDKSLFKKFNVTDGDLEWNDYELCFPIIDLYENKNIEKDNTNAA